MLGGTGGLNYMLYVRGNKDDFDDWATLGNRGWSYEEVGDIFYSNEFLQVSAKER